MFRQIGTLCNPLHIARINAVRICHGFSFPLRIRFGWELVNRNAPLRSAYDRGDLRSNRKLLFQLHGEMSRIAMGTFTFGNA